MALNLSVRRAGTILGVLALAAGAIASATPAAAASTAKPSAVATLCPSNNNKVNGEQVKANGRLELWYSPTCRTAWAVIGGWPAGSVIYVRNLDTGAQQDNTVTVDDQRTVTAAIDDAGTVSEACAETVTILNGNPHPSTICTAAF